MMQSLIIGNPFDDGDTWTVGQLPIKSFDKGVTAFEYGAGKFIAIFKRLIHWYKEFILKPLILHG